MILTVTLNAAIDKRYVVEGYQVGEVNRVKECAYTPGGKGLNVSKPASIAGAEVVATGFVGGHAGNYIEDALKPFGIKSEFYHLEEESRSCINIWDEVNHVQTEFLEPGFTVSEEEFEGFEKHFTELVKKADVVAMSGSVPKGLDGTAYQRLVRICKEAGKKVILDTSGKLLEMGIEAKPTMIKPNIDEIRMLTGKSCDNFQDMVDAAKQIHADGVEIVAVSLGGDGSFVVCDDGIFRARVPKIDAVNTVGCGDSMIAGASAVPGVSADGGGPVGAESPTMRNSEHGTGTVHRIGARGADRLNDMVGTFGKNVALPADFGNAIRPQSQLEKITYALTVGGPQPTSYLAVVLGLGLTRTREILASLVKDGVIEPIGVGRGRKYRLAEHTGS